MSSLPEGCSNWLCCPHCGSSVGLRRLGNVGVPPSMYGKRQRTRDSNRVLCEDCNTVFRSREATMLECMGRDPREEIPF